MSGIVDEVVERFELSPELVSVMTASKSAVVLGLDIGTSGVRAALFDERGREIPGASARTHRVYTGLRHFSEFDADALVESVADTIDLLMAQPFLSTDQIELISISCFWHSLLGVDEENCATTPVFDWSETRAAQAATELRARFEETQTHARTGCRFHPCYWPAKLVWLRKEQPEVFRSTSRWISFSEYLMLKLCGATTISVSMASGTGLMNQRTCEWDLPLLKELDLSTARLPQIARDIVTRLRLTGDFATRWPQLSGALFCLAIADGAANNIGSGCTTRDKLALMIGTSGAARVLFDGEPPTEIPPELWCYRADRSRVVIGGALSDGGGLYWGLQRLLFPNETAEMIEQSLETLEPDSHGLTILPFWAGERSPGWALSATGGVFGLTVHTKPIEILRATMEAIAYRFALIIKALEPLGPLTSIIATGNALQASRVWPPIIADVLGRPIMLCEEREASTRGAALLALEAAGKIPSIDEVRNDVEETFVPEVSRYSRYQQGLERQQKLYSRLI